MSGREVLTFQLGTYANYIGAHWWNIQESYFQYDERNPSDIIHDVLFREGKTLKGQVTYTPRVILVDKSEKVINIPVLSESRLRPEQVTSENNRLTFAQDKPTLEKHDFIKDLEKIDKGQRIDLSQKNYDFDNTVRSWTDYLRTRYHPRSVCMFQSSLNPLEVFHSGQDIYHTLEEGIVENIRKYMEESNNLQGFQMLVDATDAFGGLANSVLLHLQDEYSNKTILTIPAIAGYFANSNPVTDIKRTINLLLAYQKLTENSSLLVPLGTNQTVWRSLGSATNFPNIRYNSENLYHTSAILASFIDSVSLKYRLRDENCSMYDYISGLNFYSKKVCAATMSLPFPMSPDSYLLETLENLDETVPLWSQLTPGCTVSDDTIFYQKITVRGIPAERIKDPKTPPGNSRAYLCSSVEELVHMYLSYRLTTISEVTSTKVPLKTSLPYPKIFTPEVTPSGSIHGSMTRMDNYSVNSCPVITGLHCCKAVGRMLDSLHRSVKAINIKKFHEFFGAHMDIDEFKECLEKLLAMGYGHASDVALR